MKYFDSARDSALIAASTHFWCDTCLVARPKSEQSPHPGRCLPCYKALQLEATITIPSPKPTWDIIIPRGISVPPPKQGVITRRGPRQHRLPVDLIKQLATEGESSRSISQEILNRTGAVVSYRTCQRIISGQRKESK
jgi:hypothetical protein